jgi:enoyl-CoA hydratase/carnithine racemase
MEFIKYDVKDRIALITISRGKANAMNEALINELDDSFSVAFGDSSARSVVVASDRPRFFSGGFDANEVFQYDRERMTRFFGRFIDMYEKVFRSSKPIVAAVSGHAFAGGAILALICDLRVFAEGNFGFALNEVNLGFALPPGIIRLAIDAVGVGHARELLLEGSTLTPAASVRIGLAREAVPPEEVLGRAIEYARRLGEKPASAYSAIKRTIVEATGHWSSDREHLGPFIDQWFSAEAEEKKRELIESLRK